MVVNLALLEVGRQAQRRLVDETQGWIDALAIIGPDFMRGAISAIWDIGARIGIERGEAELSLLRRAVPAPRIDAYNAKKIDALTSEALRNLRSLARRRFVPMSGEAARDDAFTDGHRLTLRDSGIDDLVWVSRMDPATCSTCQARHMSKVASVFPPAHPQCRCLAVPAVEVAPITALARLGVLYRP